MSNDIVSNGVVYQYTNSVRQNSFETIKNTIDRIYNRSTKNKEIFSDLNIQIFGNWKESDMPEQSYYVKGITSALPAGEGKRIRLTTNKSFWHDVEALFNSQYSDSEIREVTTHELGHIFDFFFANPDIQLQEYLTRTYTDNEVSDKEWESLYSEYVKNDGLSDSDEFKNAWKKDIENAYKGKTQRYIKLNNKKLGYFAFSFDHKVAFKNAGRAIKADDGVNEKELEISDKCRSEVFAQLFAYALGADSSEKQDVLDFYQNTYIVVKKYIKEYLGIDCEEHKACEQISRLNCEV